MFVKKARAYPSGAPEKLPFREGSWPYPQTLDKVERLVKDKHSCLLRKFVNYGRKKIYNVGPRANVIKLFCP
jgi:hypothetical protein